MPLLGPPNQQLLDSTNVYAPSNNPPDPEAVRRARLRAQMMREAIARQQQAGTGFGSTPRPVAFPAPLPRQQQLAPATRQPQFAPVPPRRPDNFQQGLGQPTPRTARDDAGALPPPTSAPKSTTPRSSSPSADVSGTQRPDQQPLLRPSEFFGENGSAPSFTDFVAKRKAAAPPSFSDFIAKKGESLIPPSKYFEGRPGEGDRPREGAARRTGQGLPEHPSVGDADTAGGAVFDRDTARRVGSNVAKDYKEGVGEPPEPTTNPYRAGINALDRIGGVTFGGPANVIKKGIGRVTGQTSGSEAQSYVEQKIQEGLDLMGAPFRAVGRAGGQVAKAFGADHATKKQTEHDIATISSFALPAVAGKATGALGKAARGKEVEEAPRTPDEARGTPGESAKGAAADVLSKIDQAISTMTPGEKSPTGREAVQGTRLHEPPSATPRGDAHSVVLSRIDDAVKGMNDNRSVGGPKARPVIDPRVAKDRSLKQLDESINKAQKDLRAAKTPAAREKAQAKLQELRGFRVQMAQQKVAPDRIAAARQERQPASLGAAAQRGGQQLPLHERPSDYVSQTQKALPDEARAEAAKRAEAGRIKSAGYWLRDVFSPQSASKAAGRAESAIRETRGVGERDLAMAEQGFEEFRGAVARASEADRLSVMRYIEGRSQGAKLFDEKWRDVADQLRDEMGKVRAKLEDLDKTHDMAFVDDYLSHQYVDDPKRAAKLAKDLGIKMGSSGFTKARKFMTYDEAIANGKVPRTTDFIEFSLDYLKNANAYISRQKAFEIGRDAGDVKWVSPYKVPDGFTKLDGLHPNQVGHVAVASDDWARVWNNSFGAGLYSRPLLGPPMRALRQLTTFQTAAKLGFSAYHALAEAKEGIFSGIGQAAGEALRGHPLRGAATLAKGVASPLEPFLKPLTGGRLKGRGAKLRDAYLGISDHGGDYAKIADIAARAGFKVTSYDKAFKVGSGSIAKSIKRGTLKLEMQDGVKQMTGLPSTAVQLWKGVGRIMDTVADPLFERYVPDMKRAAFYERMSGWLKQNPLASEAEQLAFARRLSDSIDNRMGEMNHNNIFWNWTFKESVQAGMLSYSWALGTLREIGGGAADLARMPVDLARKGPSGVKLTQRTEYVMGMVIGEAVINSVYQYLATGQPPQDLHDVVAPRTGGVIPADRYNPERPERARIPGQIKDLYGWYTDPFQEGENKLSPTLQTGRELVTRKDWRGDPIDDPGAGVPGWLKATGKTIIEGFTPIVGGQLGSAKVGSSIGPVQRFVGISPATSFMQDAAGYNAMQTAQALRAAQTKLFHDATALEKQGDQAGADAKKREAAIVKNELRAREAYERGGKPFPSELADEFRKRREEARKPVGSATVGQ